MRSWTEGMSSLLKVQEHTLEFYDLAPRVAVEGVAEAKPGLKWLAWPMASSREPGHCSSTLNVEWVTKARGEDGDLLGIHHVVIASQMCEEAVLVLGNGPCSANMDEFA